MPDRPYGKLSSSPKTLALTITEDMADISTSLDELEAAAALPSKERPDTSAPVEAICNHGRDHGLSPEAIATVVHAITQHPPLDISNSKQLIGNLYPNQKIYKQTLYSIVSALGPGIRKPAPVVQAQLLRWLILVHGVLEDRAALTHVYAVLFNLMDFLSIRSDLCHILALSTTRRHVVPFRVSRLLDMQRATGQDPALTGLLKTYRSFRPDLVPIEALTGRASIFDYPDEEWKQRIDGLLVGQQAMATIEDETQFRVLNKTLARSKSSYIPQVYTRGSDEGHETFEDVNGIEDFANKFNRLRLPVKMASALNDPLMQHYLETLPSTSAKRYFQAVDYEIGKALEAQLELSKLDQPLDKGCIEILKASLYWAQRFKFLLPSVKSFCHEALTMIHWQAYPKLFVDLLSWSNPYYESDWREGVLSPEIEQNLLAAQGGQVLLLSLYTQMVYNRLPSVSTTEVDDSTFRSLNDFAGHVSPLALTILATSNETSAYITVAAFLQALADIATNTQKHQRRWSILPFDSRIVYLLAFASPNLSILSRLCGALADEKDAIFDSAGKGKDEHWIPGTVTRFNGFIMDMSNLIWRCRAFATDAKSDQNAAGFMLHERTRRALHEYVSSIAHVSPPYNLHNFFTVSFHPALANVAAAAWKELEDATLESTRMDVDGATDDHDDVRHRGPVTRISLQLLQHEGGVEIGWLDFRLHVLRWLGNCGANGVQKLMQRTIKALMPRDGKVQELSNFSQSQSDSPMQL